MLVTIEKLTELPDARHPHNIEVGYTRTGEFVAPPEVGKAFWLGWNWRTSPVTEIIDETTFKTYNSVYKFTLHAPTV